MTGSERAAPAQAGAVWWRDAVFYQIYVRSFADADGDGLGDLRGIVSRLPHVRELGADAVWLTPFYVSPQHDAGYDVADPCSVDPRFGTLADFDALVDAAHGLGLRVVVDIVPNHTSWAHDWFRAALDAAPGSPERARYIFREGRGPAGDEPPNNWQSVFGGPAWTRATEPDGTPGEWYLHLFDQSQPDLNWRNPEVGDMFESVLRFWLDRGVDGFRIDVAHSLFKEESLRDQVRTHEVVAGQTLDEDGGMVTPHEDDEPMWDQPEVHDVYRRWHRVLAEYPGDRMTVAEAWTKTPESMARFVRPDELSQSFNFAWLAAPWSARAFARVIESTVAALEPVGASATWVLENHDVIRVVTRYGGGEVGLARARAAALAMLALPGSAYLYQGQELGLGQVDVPPAARQDPLWFRTGEVGRDGCRVPVPWSGDEPPFGFGSGEGQPWLPQPDEWVDLTVEAQSGDPDSTLSLFRRALELRRTVALSSGDEVVVHPVVDEVLCFDRGKLRVVVNCSQAPVPLPPGEILLASGPLTADQLRPTRRSGCAEPVAQPDG
ncbi:MAG: glycoside hydrolase family 13 protein [Nocardioides sp.]|uniref:glycoside hydrolase family 13 protein n=1 Tax=Nocardioides sp. TaxID=35761 RepID=UPI0039E6332A